MATLQEIAAARAGRAAEKGPAVEDVGEQLLAEDTSGVMDMGEYEPGDGDPEMVPVHIAWLRVRRDVRSIAKRELYNGGGTRFNFRGVDTVVNTFGPVTLKHGVNVMPVGVDAQYRDTMSKANSKMRECTVCVTWMVMGPMGDTLPTTLQSQGEALDSADKGTAKAQSVALRVLLLGFGLTPTSDPDPDSAHVERGEAVVRSPESYRDEIVNPKTSFQRLQQIGQELFSAGMLRASVVNEVGDQETLDNLGSRFLRERGGAQ